MALDPMETNTIPTLSSSSSPMSATACRHPLLLILAPAYPPQIDNIPLWTSNQMASLPNQHLRTKQLNRVYKLKKVLYQQNFLDIMEHAQ